MIMMTKFLEDSRLAHGLLFKIKIVPYITQTTSDSAVYDIKPRTNTPVHPIKKQ